MSPKVDGEIIREGFVVTRTLNGGWVLTNIPEPGFMPVNRGAFTNDDDLIDFIIAELKPDLCRPNGGSGTEFVIDESLDARIAQLSEASSDGK